jgi:predicted flap endonuclease-1-like 5' DNA nuclease
MSESKSLLQKLKDFFGLSGTSQSASETEPQHSADSGTDVTVEREPEPDTDSEDAVKGTATGSESTDGEHAAPEDGPIADADKSDTAEPAELSKTMEEEEAAEDAAEEGDEEDETTAEAEEAEATAEADEKAAESDVEEAFEPEEATADEEEKTAGEPVDEINGIGPTYAGRLTEAGIETVADLAAAEAEHVSDVAQTSDSRAADWIEQAQNF